MKLNLKPSVHCTESGIGAILDMTQNDLIVFQEMLDILEKHGKSDKFGVHLIDDSIQVNSSEQLLEQTDVKSRTLITTPVKIGSIMGEAIETAWRFDVVSGTRKCEKYCSRMGQGHSKVHDTTPG